MTDQEGGESPPRRLRVRRLPREEGAPDPVPVSTPDEDQPAGAWFDTRGTGEARTSDPGAEPVHQSSGDGAPESRDGASAHPPPTGGEPGDDDPQDVGPAPGVARGGLALDERRRRVYDMSIRGVPHSTIARLLGVHRNTVLNDLAVLREEQRDRISASDPFTEIGEHERFFAEIRATALLEYQRHQDRTTDGVTLSRGDKRARFLELALRAGEAILDMHLKTGVIPRAPDEVLHGLTQVDGRDIRKMSREEILDTVARLRARMDAREQREARDADLARQVSGIDLERAAQTDPGDDPEGIPEFRPRTRTPQDGDEVDP